MGVKPDWWIRKMALEQKMIEPFEDRLVRKDVISYGLSSYGYDIRVSREFMIFENKGTTLLEVMNSNRISIELCASKCPHEPMVTSIVSAAPPAAPPRGPTPHSL